MSLELRQLGGERAYWLGGGTTMVGSLASNQITLNGPGVEPIHGMIERLEDGCLRITDLGSLVGIRVNGDRIVVDTVLAADDVIEIGALRFRVTATLEKASVKTDPDQVAARKAAAKESVVSLDDWRSRMLFAPRTPSSQGRMLEVIAYWGDTVLNVDHFHPDIRGFATVTIGDPNKAHFVAGGRDFFTSRVLANVESDGAVLKLSKDMKARVRQDGKVRKVNGLHQVHLGPTDYAHIEHGAVRYFLRYANLPRVDLPRNKIADAFFVGLSAVAALFYVVLVGLALTIKPVPIRDNDRPGIAEEPWMKKYRQEKPEPVKVKPTIAEVRVEPLKKAEPPKKHEPKPVRPTAEPKPSVKAEPKPVTPKRVIAQQVLTPPKSVQAQPTPQAPTLTPAPTKPTPVLTQNPSPNPGGAASANPHSANGKTAVGAPAGMKVPGPNLGNNGGPGKSMPTGALKGATKFNMPGVEGGKQNTPSRTDLTKLGTGLGRVLNSAGGIAVPFKSSSSGLGKKYGAASKDYNLGGPGNGNTLALNGSDNSFDGWGKGPGGVLGGGDGPGGTGNSLAGLLKGGGKGPGTGGGSHSQAQVNLPVQEPVASVGLPPGAIMNVIRSHLNEIRHCYEQLLQRQPNAAGKMTVGFSIGLDGRVPNVSVVATTVDDVVFRGCVTGKIQRWGFPKPVGGSPVQVTYPFVFTPL